MSSSSPTSLLNVDLRPGKPPMLRVEATGDAARWAAEHRDALRAAVAEHGSLLIRGLGLLAAGEAEHASGLQSHSDTVCRLLLAKQNYSQREGLRLRHNTDQPAKNSHRL